MKKITIATLIALSTMAMASMTGFAAETETEKMTEIETETEAPVTEILTVSIAGNEEKPEELTVENHTGAKFSSLEIRSTSGEIQTVYGDLFEDNLIKDEETAEPETDTDDSGNTQEGSENQWVNLVALTDDGNILVYYDALADNPDLIKVFLSEDGTSFTSYDADGNVLINGADNPVTGYEIPKTMYATEYVYVRSWASKDSDPLGTLKYVDEVTAVGEASNGWIMIEFNGGYGFVYGDYLSDNQDDAQAALEQEKAAQERAAAEAAAAAAAQQQAAPSSHSSGSSGKTVVSQEKVPNCADGNHGTVYITYSDGSVSTQDY